MTDARIPVEALEGLMKKVFLERSMQPGLFWDAVIKSLLYLPLASDAKKPPPSQSDQDLAEFPIQMGMDSEGKNILWLFTSPAAMKAYTEKEFPYVERLGQDMFRSLKESPYEVILIGPESITLSLDKNLIGSLAEGHVPKPPEEVQSIPSDTKVRVGFVDEDTSDLEARFIQLFENLPEVLEAMFMQVSDHKGPRLLLGLKLEKETREKLKNVAGQVARAAEGVLEAGKTMDITLINGSLKEAFAKWGKIFYKK